MIVKPHVDPAIRPKGLNMRGESEALGQLAIRYSAQTRTVQDLVHLFQDRQLNLNPFDIAPNRGSVGSLAGSGLMVCSGLMVS
ncbi:hypothetical protein SBA4_3200014 [Candidatus Sulfopaludibacter sp. SbA4]|nr:hypothetical protein SBA4_3200014 [Candidatus Sulfopaludibacter sp. SbA4]